MKTEAQKRANEKWIKKALESVAIRVRKGTRARWAAAAEAQGMSLAGFICEAVEEKMQKGTGG